MGDRRLQPLVVAFAAALLFFPQLLKADAHQDAANVALRGARGMDSSTAALFYASAVQNQRIANANKEKAAQADKAAADKPTAPAENKFTPLTFAVPKALLSEPSPPETNALSSGSNSSSTAGSGAPGKFSFADELANLTQKISSEGKAESQRNKDQTDDQIRKIGEDAIKAVITETKNAAKQVQDLATREAEKAAKEANAPAKQVVTTLDRIKGIPPHQMFDRTSGDSHQVKLEDITAK